MTDPVLRSGRFSFMRTAPFIFGLVFCIGLIGFEFFFVRSRYPETIFLRLLDAGSYGRLLVFLALSFSSVVLTFLFFWAAFSSRAIFRAFYLLVFSVLIAAEYGFFRAFDRFSHLEDVAIALTGVDGRMAGNAATHYVNWIAIFPIAAFTLLLVMTRKHVSNGSLTAVGVILSSLLFFSVSTYFTSNLYYAPSIENAARTMISFPVGWYIGTVNGPPEALVYGSPRDALTYSATEPPKNNIVLIIDESIRGDHLSINGYQKPTTPILEELSKKGLVANWGIASSGGTCSRTSNMMLITGINTLPDPRFDVYRMPTIFQYARAMGYRNYYFDGQTNLLWNAKELDVPDFGTWVKADEIAQNAPQRYDRDAEIARRVRQIVTPSTGNFIVVNKHGLHPPYEDAYPNEHYSESLRPLSPDYLSQNESELSRVYDEAVTFNLQSFFSTLLAEPSGPDTIYLYTSDHGQSLQGGGRATHCLDSIPEATVPLMMIADPSRLAGIDTNFRASHFNIFATLLDLMQYPEQERKYSYSVSLLKAKAGDSAPRFFYTDDLQIAKPHRFDN